MLSTQPLIGYVLPENRIVTGISTAFQNVGALNPGQSVNVEFRRVSFPVTGETIANELYVASDEPIQFTSIPPVLFSAGQSIAVIVTLTTDSPQNPFIGQMFIQAMVTFQ